jgi:hypothetical protein
VRETREKSGTSETEPRGLAPPSAAVPVPLLRAESRFSRSSRSSRMSQASASGEIHEKEGCEAT